jgi:hypothetical protein
VIETSAANLDELSRKCKGAAAVEHSKYLRAILLRIQACLLENKIQSDQGLVDQRPLLAALLTTAEEAILESAHMLEMSLPDDPPFNAVGPLQRQHAELLNACSLLHCRYAEATVEFAGDDLSKQRPAFPMVPGADASAVQSFLDSTYTAALQEMGAAAADNYGHVDSALLYAHEAITLLRGHPGAAQGYLVLARMHALLWHKTIGNSALQASTDVVNMKQPRAADHTEPVNRTFSTSGASPEPMLAQQGGSLGADATPTAQEPSEQACAAILPDAKAHALEAAEAATAAVRSAATAHDWSIASHGASILALIHSTEPIKAAHAVCVLRACGAAKHLQAMLGSSASREHVRHVKTELTPGQCFDSNSAYDRLRNAVLRAVELDSPQEVLTAAMNPLPVHVRILTLEVARSGFLHLALLSWECSQGNQPSNPELKASASTAKLNLNALKELREKVSRWGAQLLRKAGSSNTSTDVADVCNQRDTQAKYVGSKWADIVLEMDQLLGPFSVAMAQAAAPVLLPVTPEAPVKGKTKGKPAEKTPGSKEAAIVLCLAEELAWLPLEAATALRNAGCICRDVSLFALSQRAEAGKESTNVQLTKAVHVSCEPIREMLKTLVVDKFGAQWTSETLMPQVTQNIGHQVKLWQTTPVLLFTAEQCLEEAMPLSALSSADLSTVRLAIILERMRIPGPSLRRQQAVPHNNGKAHALQHPGGLGSLLLSCGLKCCIIAQFPCSPEAASQALEDILSASTGGKTFAEAVQLVRAAAPVPETDDVQSWLARNVLVFGLPHLTVESSPVIAKTKRP